MFARKVTTHAVLGSIAFVAFSSTVLKAQDPSDPPASIARVSYITGEVALQAYGTDAWADAPPNYPLVGGDRIYTEPGSRAIIQLGGAELRVWQNTDVTLTNQTDQFDQIGLAQGSIRLRVFEMSPGSQIEVDTPNGAVLIETPGDYRVDASLQTGSSSALVSSGAAQLAGPGLNLAVNAGYDVEMYGNKPIQLQYLNMPSYDGLDTWSLALDRRLQNSISARYVSRQMVGYGDLDANGTWVPQSEYGPVWYPNNVPDGWRPYSNGHWAYVAPWGYTWVDDAPWGFAPFHYGRWSVIQGRWGWVPGPPAVRPVYSPALVAFVGGGPGLSVGFSFAGDSGAVAAWFPIGVGEPYVPWYHCTPNYARQVNISNVNVAAIRNMTIVNNYNTYITNVHVTNTTITNTTVNNFNYANRTAVTAVPVNAMSSGTSVAWQQVRLSSQQQQQLAQAPISVRPTAPVPTAPHPSLVAKANVAQPAARPALITPAGVARAVPSAIHAQPINVSRLPAPKIVPKNAPPAPQAPGQFGSRIAAPAAVPVRQNAPPQPAAQTGLSSSPQRQPGSGNNTRPAEIVRQAKPAISTPAPATATPVARPANPNLVPPARTTGNSEPAQQTKPSQLGPAQKPNQPAVPSKPVMAPDHPNPVSGTKATDATVQKTPAGAPQKNFKEKQEAPARREEPKPEAK